MLNIIKTAIITIIISFISGLLLDYYKNLAPRILCNVQNGIPLQLSNRKFFAYIITVSNLSNKTIHELTLNIQSSQTSLMNIDAKITEGLKFDSSIKDKNLDFYIPYLSKGDEFSVTVCAENQYSVHIRPVITIRSPENFKEIDSAEHSGILSLLFNIPQNISNLIMKTKVDFPNIAEDSQAAIDASSDTDLVINKNNREVPYEDNKFTNNKKLVIIIGSIILVAISVVLLKLCFQETSANGQAPVVNTVVPIQSDDTSKTTNNTGLKELTNKAAQNTDMKSSSGNTAGNKADKSFSENAAGSKDNKLQSENTAGNADNKPVSGNTSENTGTKLPSENTAGDTNNKAASGNAAENAGNKSSSGNTTENTGNKSSSGNTADNTASSDGAAKNTSN